ncbi:MAG: hypothetical protein ACI4O0_06655 [Candidatus Limivicinus sp.]
MTDHLPHRVWRPNQAAAPQITAPAAKKFFFPLLERYSFSLRGKYSFFVQKIGDNGIFSGNEFSLQFQTFFTKARPGGTHFIHGKFSIFRTFRR